MLRDCEWFISVLTVVMWIFSFYSLFSLSLSKTHTDARMHAPIQSGKVEDNGKTCFACTQAIKGRKPTTIATLIPPSYIPLPSMAQNLLNFSQSPAFLLSGARKTKLTGWPGCEDVLLASLTARAALKI